MHRTKRTLRALVVILMGMWALSATPADASTATFASCDEWYCIPNESSCEDAEIWCNNACPGYVGGSCSEEHSVEECQNGILIFCISHPE